MRRPGDPALRRAPPDGPAPGRSRAIGVAETQTHNAQKRCSRRRRRVSTPVLPETNGDTHHGGAERAVLRADRERARQRRPRRRGEARCARPRRDDACDVTSHWIFAAPPLETSACGPCGDATAKMQQCRTVPVCFCARFASARGLLLRGLRRRLESPDCLLPHEEAERSHASRRRGARSASRCP